MNLARKISRAKWDEKEYLAAHEIPADALTGCLRTSGNTLSWWFCEADRRDVAEVVLALAYQMDHFEKIDIIVLDENRMREAGLRIEPTAGQTPVIELQSRHRDVAHLDAERLCHVGRLILELVRRNDSIFTFTKRQVIEIIQQALSTSRVRREDLKEKLRASLDA